MSLMSSQDEGILYFVLEHGCRQENSHCALGHMQLELPRVMEQSRFVPHQHPTDTAARGSNTHSGLHPEHWKIPKMMCARSRVGSPRAPCECPSPFAAATCRRQ